MKRIGLTQRLVIEPRYSEIREALDVSWGRLFAHLEWLPVPLPIEADFSELLFQLGLDGVLLTGGNDVSTISDDPLSRRRDAAEREIVQTAIAQRKPVIGVCRGMQYIGTFFGGKLEPLKQHVARTHSIHLMTEDPRIAPLLSPIEAANSYHNFGFTALPPELIPLALGPEDCIEAFVHESLPIFGQMWHPERSDPFRRAEIELLKQMFHQLEKRSWYVANDHSRRRTGHSPQTTDR